MTEWLKWTLGDPERRLATPSYESCLEVVDLAALPSECNFVVFRPSRLPPDCTLAHISLRRELPPGRPAGFDAGRCKYPTWTEANRSAVRMVVSGANRSLRIKQFFHDWTFPSVRLSNLYGTGNYSPAPMGYDVAWLGHDYKGARAATIELERTTVEISVERGNFSDEEMYQLLMGLVPVDEQQAQVIHSLTHPELSYYARYQLGEISSPIGVFKFRRAIAPKIRHWLSQTDLQEIHPWITRQVGDFHFDSGYLAGTEVALVYRHDEAPGIQLWSLYIPIPSSYITLPPEHDFLGQGSVHSTSLGGVQVWYASVDERYGPFELLANYNNTIIIIWIDSNTLNERWQAAEQLIELVYNREQGKTS